ncbi:MAG: beta-lactamase family protein [Bacteroidales bacterium]|nr:beta-lactamase family protein [Bacteroidales bacterium]
MANNRSRIALVSLLFLVFLFPSCHVARYVWWNYADIKDCDKFPVVPISPSENPKPFKSSADNHTAVKYSGLDRKDTLEDYLRVHKTVAFLIIRNDSIIYEKYFNGYKRESILPSFSVAKSFISALIGIAIQEGKIKSINQPITDFLPELKDPGFRQVTLKDLLEMRSGISFKEEYANPFGGMAKFYYGLDLSHYTLNLKTENNPGTQYNYQSANTQLLAMALERVTGMSVAKYLEEKIWKPMGSEYPASWSIDSQSDSEVKAFCCINARAIDFAKFGQLFLNGGEVEGKSIVPPPWISESLLIQTDSRDSQGFPYTYHWRVTENGDFFAKGILGQYIFVSPQNHVVIVRFGKKSSDVIWAEFFRKLL